MDEEKPILLSMILSILAGLSFAFSVWLVIVQAHVVRSYDLRLRQLETKSGIEQQADPLPGVFRWYVDWVDGFSYPQPAVRTDRKKQ